MTHNNPLSDRYFSQGHKTLTRGTFIFGGTLFFIAVLIFAYPTLIAYFIAGVILLAGISILALAWKFSQLRNYENFTSAERWETSTPVNSNRPTRIFYFRWMA